MKRHLWLAVVAGALGVTAWVIVAWVLHLAEQAQAVS